LPKRDEVRASHPEWTECLKNELIRMLVVVDLAADVGPEFFGYVAERVEGERLTREILRFLTEP
jgi:hypothetical protein